MKIDRNNYEIYFLDYLEGRLTAEQTAGLLLFVEENPDLKALIEGEEWNSLVADKTINFLPKSALKRESIRLGESGLSDNASLLAKTAISTPGINSRNYEEFMVRYHENDLNDFEKAALADFLKDNPIFIREFEMFGNTLLKADIGITYLHKSGLKRNILPRFGAKRVLAMIAVAASVLFFSTLFLRYINQPIPGKIDKQIVLNVNRSNDVKKVLTTKGNFAESKPIEINRAKSTKQLANTVILKTNTFDRTSVELKGIEPSIKHLKTKTTERITVKALTSLNIRQSTLLTTTRISVPRTMERRTDFDGITSTAYYDPDPDALPLSTDGKTIPGRLGYTLARGISQTAGAIVREPELGRVLTGNFSLSAIADLGLAGFNLITDSKLSISRDYNSNGHLQGFYLNDGDRRSTRLP
jgi:hypothetical protein